MTERNEGRVEQRRTGRAAALIVAWLLGLFAPGAFAQTWTKIADESQTFSVSGTQTVRYGAGSSWIQMSVTGSGTCSNAYFGSDPIPGTVKECDVLYVAPSQWTKIADEGQTFSVSGTQTVQYGAGSSWIQMSVTGSGTCSNAYFGSDPIPGTVKECDVQSGAAPASLLANSSFEAPALGTGGYSYGTSGGSWVFIGSAGVTNNGSAFTYQSPVAPDGTQAGFIQGTGTASQTLSLAAGSYSLTFQAVQRGGINQNGAQVLRVSVDGTTLGTFQPPSGSYGSSPVYTFSVLAGSHTVQFTGVGSGSDYTAFVDSVNLVKVDVAPTSLLANSSFETPALGTGNYSYGTSGASWVFTGNAGVTSNSSTYTYGSPNAPDGVQTGFIQLVGTASQTLSLAAGSYSLTFQAVQRVAYQSGTQVLRVSVDGTTIGTFQPPSGSYATSPVYTFSALAGSHTLQITGVGSGSDYTAFVDSVALVRTGNAVVLPSPPVSAAPVVNYEYDAQGNPTRTIQAPGVSGFGFATQASYDALNRAKDTTDARSGKTSFGYDALDRTTSVTDPRSLVTQSPRNGLGDTTQLVSPDTGTATMTYDAAGNLKTRLDSRGVTQAYSYDALNRPTLLAYTQSGQAQLAFGWNYDEPGASNGVGRLTSSSFPAGTGSYAYDPLGRLTTQVQTVAAASGANASAVQSTVRYAYDAAGHVTTLTYPSGRVLVVTYTGGKPSALALAASSNATATPLLTQILLSPFGGPISWQQQMASGARAMSRTYDLSGRLVRLQLGSFVRDIAYDAADRIAGYTHYDAATGTATTAATALNQSFGYDELGRITSVATPSASWTIGYDANGNRTGMTLNATTSAYSTEATSNRLTAITNPARSFGYDSAGNTTVDTGGYSATYDLAGRMASLTKASMTTSYVYDANGQRVRKFDTSGSASTLVFVYDQDGQLLGEYDSTGNALREYVWLGSTPVAMFTPDPANASNPPQVFYLHTDHLDTPRVALDQNNNVRWRWMAEPFGSSAPENNPANLGAFSQPLRFPGQYADQESGLFYNWMRSYDGTIGRYAQSDPIGLNGGINTYAYVNGNPLSAADPLGLWATDAHDYFIDQAFPQLSPQLRDIIKEGSAYVDTPKFQGDASAGLHAMTSKTMSQAQAREQMCKFIKDNLGRSNAAKALDDPRYLYYLGMALHPVMDYTSPAHRGWQMWHGASDASKHGPWPTSLENLAVAKQSRYTQETVDLIKRALSGDLECECR